MAFASKNKLSAFNFKREATGYSHTLDKERPSPSTANSSEMNIWDSPMILWAPPGDWATSPHTACLLCSSWLLSVQLLLLLAITWHRHLQNCGRPLLQLGFISSFSWALFRNSSLSFSPYVASSCL